MISGGYLQSEIKWSLTTFSQKYLPVFPNIHNYISTTVKRREI